MTMNERDPSTLRQRVPRRLATRSLASLLCLALVSAVAILLAYLVSAEPWAVLLGVGGAQIVMVTMAVRQGLRT